MPLERLELRTFDTDVSTAREDRFSHLWDLRLLFGSIWH